MTRISRCELTREREKIALVIRDLEQKIAFCCAEQTGKRFCESYGCSTLQEIIWTLKADIQSANDVVSAPAMSKENGE